MLDTNKIINDFVNDAWWAKENSNIPYSIMSLNNKIAERAHAYYWLSEVYTPEIRKGFDDRLFHIHNLGHLTTYCVGWNTEDILLKGFKGQPGRQTSKPAKHFRAALGQMYNYLYTLQGEAAGAEALNNFDTYLAPFIFYDRLDQNEVDQCIQEFIFNMNVPTRVGGQQPFTNITMDQRVPKFMSEEKTVRGGKYTKYTYGDFQDEIEMLNNAWWKQRIKGDGDGRPQPFPIETLNVTEEFDWDDELLFRAVALRGTPYFSNFLNTDMNPEDVRSMCCRIRINNTVLNRRGGGFFGSSPLTGSIGVTTLNLPLIAYLSKDEDKFFELISYALELMKQSLELKRTEIEKNTIASPSLYPFSKLYLDGVYERFGEYWKNHFSTIGLVGMNEACLNLIGEGIDSEAGLKLSVKVLNFLRQKALEFQEETDNMWNIEATPAEGTAYRLAMMDKAQYPDIIVSGIDKAPYYTNSTQLPVGLDKSLGYHLNHQNKLQPLYTGGTVFHVWNGERSSWWEGVSKLVRRIAEGTELSYYTYSPTTSVCPVHGLMSGEVWECPHCGAVMEVWQRITGYFSPVNQWNAGKVQEFSERIHFKVPEDPRFD